MKKLMILASAAVAAMFSTTAAQADVSVSGSYGFHAISGSNVLGGESPTDGDVTTSGTLFMQGGGVSFSMSTTTAGGMSVSASGGVSLDSNDADNTKGVSGLDSVTFSADGFSLQVGEVDIPAADGVGEVGFVASAVVDNGGYTQTGIATGVSSEGYGFVASTSVSGASISLGYLADYANSGVNNAETASGDYASGLSISAPMGSATVTLGAASQSGTTDASTTGASISLPVGGMTAKVGYEATSTTGAADATTAAGSISGSLDADTTWAVGYSDGEKGTLASTMLEAKLSRSLGGGVSVYAEIQNTSGSGTSGTNIAAGTTVAF
jgi:hypothetical protein